MYGNKSKNLEQYQKSEGSYNTVKSGNQVIFGILKELERSMNAPEYNSWVRPLEFDLKENNFNIYAPNEFIENFFREKYLPKLMNLLENSIGRNRFILNLAVQQTTNNISSYDRTGLNDNYIFESFVEGKSN